MSLIPPNPTTSEEDSQVCTPEHCYYAFDTLYTTLTRKKALPPKFPDEKFPLFVTWNVRRPGKTPRLRGCIGNFTAQPLHQGLAEYALVSAFEDHRFRKIEERELESLECSISLLTDFEDASSYLDWTVGVHGIYITFPHPSLVTSDRSEAPSPLSSSSSVPTRSGLGRSFTATYLPQIAEEQGWDKLETIDSAIQKAGWNGRITEDLRRSIKLRRYQSRKCTVGWDEYVEWRKQNGGKM
ncbi:AMMECR1 domain-containing protein [Cristinia sonorae]|uniref:AMMECR1 domain-containing protein n=1 Tax=Cristinia sonorae TaxID=1940300 RepID=A0A8K0UYJ7_9AGAR|nr:AMMECR1 domain-containing protein [Cristinia sonorae]